MESPSLLLKAFIKVPGAQNRLSCTKSVTLLGDDMEIFPKNLEIRLPSDSLSKYIKVYQNFNSAYSFHFLWRHGFKSTRVSSVALPVKAKDGNDRDVHKE